MRKMRLRATKPLAKAASAKSQGHCSLAQCQDGLKAQPGLSAYPGSATIYGEMTLSFLPQPPGPKTHFPISLLRGGMKEKGWRGISLGRGRSHAFHPSRPFPEGKDQMRLQSGVESVRVEVGTPPGPGLGLSQNQEQDSVYSRSPHHRHCC